MPKAAKDLVDDTSGVSDGSWAYDFEKKLWQLKKFTLPEILAYLLFAERSLDNKEKYTKIPMENRAPILKAVQDAHAAFKTAQKECNKLYKIEHKKRMDIEDRLNPEQAAKKAEANKKRVETAAKKRAEKAAMKAAQPLIAKK